MLKLINFAVFSYNVSFFHRTPIAEPRIVVVLIYAFILAVSSTSTRHILYEPLTHRMMDDALTIAAWSFIANLETLSAAYSRITTTTFYTRLERLSIRIEVKENQT